MTTATGSMYLSDIHRKITIDSYQVDNQGKCLIHTWHVVSPLEFLSTVAAALTLKITNNLKHLKMCFNPPTKSDKGKVRI